jgi:hypothetical protein
MAVCPVDCFYRTDEGVVLHDKDICIGCGYCSYACPFGAPQFPSSGTFGLRGKMDKCTFCAGGPEKNGTLAEFEKYGLGSLAESVEALILNGTPKSEATLKLRATEQYQVRFAGNTQRLASGKNLYDESTYLALENDFQTSFEAYGQKALLGNTRESAQAMFAEYIGSDKSPTEIKDRIRLAVDEVSNRKDIRSEFQKFFPEITDSDLVSYFLKPKETLSALNAKVRVAQIGSAASAQGLNASLTTATDLEQLGLTEQQARTGYQRVATDLPTIEKLGDIDKTDIGQTTAENAYLKGLASEQRKIDKAAERERNRYAQSSGMNKVSLTDVKPAGQY